MLKKSVLLLTLLFIFLNSSLILADFGLNDVGNDKITLFSTVKSQDCINLIQTCSNCSYVNISSILYPNSTEALGQVVMTKSGTSYNYTFCDTDSNGDYIVNGHGDDNGDTKVFQYWFKVSPSGKEGNENIIFILLVIIGFYAITFIAFFGRNIPISILGGMSLIGLGVYIIRNGLIVYRDWITNYFSYVTLGVGFIIAAWALIEMNQ